MIYVCDVLQTLVAGYNTGNICTVAEDIQSYRQYDEVHLVNILKYKLQSCCTLIYFVDKANKNYFLYITIKIKLSCHSQITV